MSASSRAPGQPLRVAVFPQPEHYNNPYLTLLYDALGQRGVELVPRAALTPRWAWNSRSRVDVVHVHWLEELLRTYDHPVKDFVPAWLKAAGLLGALAGLRRAGVRVVWTVHNLRPHEPRFPRLEAGVSRRVLRLADSVIVHSQYAADRVEEAIDTPADVHVVPHGNYVSVYPDDCRDRRELRRALGLPSESFVYLMFGNVRKYKRVPEAIRAFRSLTSDDVRLVVAGWVHPFELPSVREAAGDDSRIVLHLDQVPDEDVAAYHHAADAVVLNYREVFSSGALMLALSFGVPVVAPAPSTATEIAPPPAIEGFAGDSLADALAAIRGGDRRARRQAALAVAEACSWDRAAVATLAAYGALGANGSS